MAFNAQVTSQSDNAIRCSGIFKYFTFTVPLIALTLIGCSDNNQTPPQQTTKIVPEKIEQINKTADIDPIFKGKIAKKYEVFLKTQRFKSLKNLKMPLQTFG